MIAVIQSNCCLYFFISSFLKKIKNYICYDYDDIGLYYKPLIFIAYKTFMAPVIFKKNPINFKKSFI